MSRRLLPLVGALALLLPWLGCRSNEPVWPKDKKLRVLTSFAPLYCFAKSIAGDDAHVECLLTTKGPHGYRDPTNRDKGKIRGAQIIFVNGLGLDDIVEDLSKRAVNSEALCEVAKKIGEDKLLPTDESEHKHDHADHHHHGHFDPHV